MSSKQTPHKDRKSNKYRTKIETKQHRTKTAKSHTKKTNLCEGGLFRLRRIRKMHKGTKNLTIWTNLLLV
jgi:hypothetical protein